MKNNMDALNEIHKGCSMGIIALEMILKKTDDNSFKELLENQLKEYQDISIRSDELYKEYTSSEIDTTNMMEKLMTFYGIEKDTILDSSSSHLADILINGTNMGIVEGRKILNNKKLDKHVKKICKEYITVQEKYLDKLKEYL